MTDPPPDGVLGRLLFLTRSIRVHGDQINLDPPNIHINKLHDLIEQLEVLLLSHHNGPSTSTAPEPVLLSDCEVSDQLSE